jgi:hypothetical protein
MAQREWRIVISYDCLYQNGVAFHLGCVSRFFGAILPVAAVLLPFLFASVVGEEGIRKK